MPPSRGSYYIFVNKAHPQSTDPKRKKPDSECGRSKHGNCLHIFNRLMSFSGSSAASATATGAGLHLVHGKYLGKYIKTAILKEMVDMEMVDCNIII